jgi:zinc/manganese transport system permease protein
MQANPTLSWNLARDASEVLEYHFMVNALLAGAIVSVLAGLLGWLMILRRETFAGHTLAMMAFPGAAWAALVGIPAAWGYFVFCGAGALSIARFSGARGHRWSEQSASIGAVQAFALALGFLFVSLYGGVLGDLENLLFGTVLGISDGQVLTLAAIAACSLLALALLGRPLLFSSVDPDLAHARGVPVRALSVAFLALLGLAVAAASQITGVLLVFALLVAPPATAQAITTRPAWSLGLTVAIALVIVWVGLAISYFSVYPAGFFITTIAFALYVLARACTSAARARGRRRGARRERAEGGDRAPEGVIA